ncbi:MAG: DUF433 domain-containing protein [Oceanicaulis sp.]|nr:DUF433 domain-containing protein [Oceanicaulis sp.]
MTLKDAHPRISADPAIMVGKPCIKGTRVPVYLIVMMFAEGETLEDVLEAYPHITAEDVRAALAYAADRSADTVLPAAE